MYWTMFRFTQVIQSTSSSSRSLSDLTIIKFILSQSFYLIAAARIIISSLKKSLSILIVSQTAILINLKTLNSRALMKKLFMNITKSRFEERLLHNCMIIKNDEVSFHLLIENFNCFVVINWLVLIIWVKMFAFQIWSLHILISNLRDEKKINKIIFLTQTIQFETHFSSFTN
jgi:hypothetical protein